MATTHHFRIAGFYVRIVFQASKFNGIHQLENFKPFAIDEPTDEKPLFQLTVDDTIRPISKDQRRRIRDCDTGNGNTLVDKLDDGGYQFIMRDIEGYDCCLTICNKDFSNCRCALNGTDVMRRFGLNNALMLICSFAASKYQTLLIHASLVRHNGYGYAFIAQSGTGKSTQVSQWLRHIPGCDLMNDDNPIIRIIDGEPWIFGTPWSGKTPCYRNVKARLGAVTRIDRAPANSIDHLHGVEAFANMLPSCSGMKWDNDIYNNVCDTVTKIAEYDRIFTLHCLPDEEAARVCFEEVTKIENQQR